MRFCISLFALCFSGTCLAQYVHCETTGDKQSGVYTEYHINCNKKIEAHYRNGAPDGPYREWTENGALSVRGAYLNGLKEGTWRRYDTLLSTRNRITPGKGNYKYSEYTYSDGKLQSAYEYVSTGDSLAPKSGEVFVRYEKDTLATHRSFYDNGQLSREYFTHPDQSLEGVSRDWRRNGELLSERTTLRGAPVKQLVYKQGYTELTTYKNGKPASLRQSDPSGKVLYEELYDSKGKAVKKSGTKR